MISWRRPCALLLLSVACVSQAPPAPSQEDLQAARANILTEAPSPRFPVNADLQGMVKVLGCDVEPQTVEPGKPVTVTTYWKVERPLTDGWRMFFHTHGAGRSQYQNHDHGPLGGKYPVSAWKPGDILRDVYRFTLPANWQGEELNLYTGIWRGTERLKVTSGPRDEEHRVHLARLVVQRPPGMAAQAPSRKRILARKIKKPPVIDGKLDDAVWREAAETEPFVATLTGAPVADRTTAKIVYDEKNLYVAFQSQDSDVWATRTEHDDKLWREEVVEVMIDGDGDGASYIELQVAPTGATFDSYLPSYRQNQNDWESGMKAAVKVQGTLNQREDADKGWTVELALPLEAVKGRSERGPVIPPRLGDTWRINLFRMDSPKGKPQIGSGWSPPLVGDFHALSKFGDLVFADERGELPRTVSAELPSAVPTRRGEPAAGGADGPSKSPVRKVSSKKAP